MKRNSQVLKGLLFSTALVVAQAVAAQETPVEQQPAAQQPQQVPPQPGPDQEPAAETGAEGDAKAQGQPAVPTSEELTADQRSLNEIIITGRITYRNRTDTVAPELTYGQEFFQKFEPTSVGDQLKRVPGVAFTSDIGEYDAPALRGLGAGFTQILVNGRPVPGAGNDRSVFVDRIPAEIIDRIEIIRSPTADMDSQGIGGTINIILKDGTSLPPGVIARAALLYFPDGDVFKGSGAVSWSGRNPAETVAWSLTVDAQQRYNPKLTRQEVFTEDSPGFEQSSSGLDLFRPFDRNGSKAVERSEELDTRRSFDLSFNGDITFQIGESSKLRFDGFYIRTRRTDTEQTLDRERDSVEDPWEIDAIEMSKEPFTQDNFGLSGLYESKVAENMSFEGQVRYSQFKEESADSTFEFDDDGIDLDTFESTDVVSDGTEELTETEAFDIFDRELSGDAALKTDFGAWNLKVGVAGKLKNRRVGQALGEDLDDPDDAETTVSEFRYRENRLDGFALAEFKLGGGSKLQAGVRGEYTSTHQRIRPDLSSSEEEEASSSEFHLNPSAHLQIPLGNGLQARASVARTVRRPNIDQVVPFSQVDDPEDNDITVGNPDLKFETSWGVDVGLEQRIQRGVVGINAFYRRVKNLIALVNTGVPSVPDADPDSEEARARIYTYDNVGNGEVYGFEFDLSAPLSFVGLEDTGIFANYTRLWSSRHDPFLDEDVGFEGQPDYVYNFGLTQEFPTLGASAGFSYRKQGESVSWFLGEEEHQFYTGSLEAYVEKRIGKNFVLRLSGSNLLDAHSTQYERNFDGDTALDIIDNQRAGNVDNFEVEHEETSPQIMLTGRLVF